MTIFDFSDITRGVPLSLREPRASGATMEPFTGRAPMVGPSNTDKFGNIDPVPQRAERKKNSYPVSWNFFSSQTITASFKMPTILRSHHGEICLSVKIANSGTIWLASHPKAHAIDSREMRSTTPNLRAAHFRRMDRRCLSIFRIRESPWQSLALGQPDRVSATYASCARSH